jgi:hypothetical protein
MNLAALFVCLIYAATVAPLHAASFPLVPRGGVLFFDSSTLPCVAMPDGDCGHPVAFLLDTMPDTATGSVVAATAVGLTAALDVLRQSVESNLGLLDGVSGEAFTAAAAENINASCAVPGLRVPFYPDAASSTSPSGFGVPVAACHQTVNDTRVMVRVLVSCTTDTTSWGAQEATLFGVADSGRPSGHDAAIALFASALSRNTSSSAWGCAASALIFPTRADDSLRYAAGVRMPTTAQPDDSVLARGVVMEFIASDDQDSLFLVTNVSDLGASRLDPALAPSARCSPSGAACRTMSSAAAVCSDDAFGAASDIVLSAFMGNTLPAPVGASLAATFTAYSPCLDVPVELLRAVARYVPNVTCDDRVFSIRSTSPHVIDADDRASGAAVPCTFTVSGTIWPAPLSFALQSDHGNTSRFAVSWESLLLGDSAAVNGTREVPLCLRSTGTIDAAVRDAAAAGAATEAPPLIAVRPFEASGLTTPAAVNATALPRLSLTASAPAHIRLGWRAWAPLLANKTRTGRITFSRNRAVAAATVEWSDSRSRLALASPASSAVCGSRQVCSKRDPGMFMYLGDRNQCVDMRCPRLIFLRTDVDPDTGDVTCATSELGFGIIAVVVVTFAVEALNLLLARYTRGLLVAVFQRDHAGA